MISFHTITYNTPLYTAMIALRDKVLRQPLGLVFSKEELEKDQHDLLLGAMENEELIACVILTNIAADSFKLRQMAVTADYQKKGIGLQLIQYAEQQTLLHHKTKIELNARLEAVPFYIKAGYKPIGEQFEEVGIAHLKMEKVIGLFVK